jgi:hypothetical protein
MIPVGVFLSLYDTAACFEGLGVLASLKRSVSLVLGHLGQVLVFIVTTVAVLFVTGLALLILWTTALFEQLEPLSQLTAAELAGFGPSQFAVMVGTWGLALAAVLYACFIVFGFVLVTAYKSRLFKIVAADQPAVPEGVYDEKGRWYRY